MGAAPGWWVAWLAASAGLLAGVFATQSWARRKARQRKRIPKHWPLDPRRMASTAECLVWRWLDRAFIDHHVMIKVPVTRFTLPRGQQDSAHWHQLLNGVYCTFTVCAPDGHVVGCVDVVGPSGISRNNRQLKLTLLSQCGIAYWVVKPGHFPPVTEIRTEFLGNDTSRPSRAGKDEVALALAREKLRSVVERQRHQRPSSPAEPANAGREGPGNGRDTLLSDSDFHAGHWQQPNSFIAPLDSRRAELG